MFDKGNKKLFLSFTGAILFSIFYFISSVSLVQAADLYFSPNSGYYQIGENFSVNLFVSSRDQATNAVSAQISFSPDKVEVVSLSKENTIFNFWLQEPAFLNKIGKIDFEGVVFNPGFQGTSGQLIKINFKVKNIGRAEISLTLASVLANDGKGTNILAGLGTANFNFVTSREVESVGESTTPTNIVGTPGAVQISSPTHPDPEKWYAEKNATFLWKPPANITGLRYSYNKNAVYIPSNESLSTKSISSTELKSLMDGVWYFHLQFRNANGWGTVSHFRFRIDAQPPQQFSILQIDEKKEEKCPTFPRPSFNFETKDAVSGVEYFEIKIDEGPPIIISLSDLIKNKGYTLDPQKPGDHLLNVKAVDLAGNYSYAFKQFCIGALEAPVFTKYPTIINKDEDVVIEGLSFPQAKITIWLENEQGEIEEAKVESNEDGNFYFMPKIKLTSSLYAAWAVASNLTGAISNPSEKINFIVEEPWAIKFGRSAINYLSIIIVLIALFVLVAVGILFFIKEIKKWKNRLNVEVDEADKSSKEAFDYLKKEIDEQVGKIDGQEGLSEREKETSENLKKSIDISEKIISKEINDIKKELK